MAMTALHRAGLGGRTSTAANGRAQPSGQSWSIPSTPEIWFGTEEPTHDSTRYVAAGLWKERVSMAHGWFRTKRKTGSSCAMRIRQSLADVFSTAAVFSVFLAKGLIPSWLFAILMVRYGMLIVGSFILFVTVGPIEFRATLPGKIVGVVQAVGIVVIIVCVSQGLSWKDTVAPVLFPLLGFFFLVIVVSQLILGYRHYKRYART